MHCQVPPIVTYARFDLRKGYAYKYIYLSTNLLLHFCRSNQCRIRIGGVGQTCHRSVKRIPIKLPELM